MDAVLPKEGCAPLLAVQYGGGMLTTSHCLQDLGDSSKNLMVVMWDDKGAESEEDRKVGTKQNKKRQSEEKSDNRMVVSGRESRPARSGGLHNCTNPTLRFQFLPLISELALPTHVVGHDQIYCPETASF